MKRSREIIDVLLENYVLCVKEDEPDRIIRQNSIILYDLLKLRITAIVSEGVNQIIVYRPADGETIKTYTPMYEFDELQDDVQEKCIESELADVTARERAIQDLRHMKFDKEGKILRGYDEE